MTTDRIDVNFSHARQLGQRLIEQLDTLRERSPIYWSEQQRAWIVTGHSQVALGLRGTLPLSANRVPRVLSFLPEAERETRVPYAIASLRRMLISLDPPEHQRMRRLLMRAFSRPVVERYRPDVQRIVDETLARVPASQPFDFVEEVARQIPSRTILKLMGLPEDYLPKLRRWTWAILSGFGGGGTTAEILDQTEIVLHEMRAAFLLEIERRRAEPCGDFITSLLMPDETGEVLSEEEVLATCYLVLIAGHDTTANTIGLGTVALSRDAQAWQFFRETTDAAKLVDAVMEISRCVSMTTTMGRVVKEDFEWEGRQLHRGDIVYLMIASANRDEKIFADPLQMDFSRSQISNMSFGPGMHFCIGHLLAKLQLTEFFPALTRRFDALTILDRELQWGTQVNFRGLQSLTVELTPRRPS